MKKLEYTSLTEPTSINARSNSSCIRYVANPAATTEDHGVARRHAPNGRPRLGWHRQRLSTEQNAGLTRMNRTSGPI
jgi:hypothetical protein